MKTSYRDIPADYGGSSNTVFFFFLQESYFQSNFVFREYESTIQGPASRLWWVFQRRYSFLWSRITFLKVRYLFIYLFIYYSIVSNHGWCDMDNELERMWKEAAVAWFDLLFRHLPERKCSVEGRTVMKKIPVNRPKLCSLFRSWFR
jgi:hypothetical protein